MMTCETPSDEFERSSSMLLMVLTASSILSLISVSTSSGAAPGSRVVTTTVGKSTFGKAIEAEPMNAKAPTTVSDRMMTVAKTGRRTEMDASHCMSGYLRSQIERKTRRQRAATVCPSASRPFGSVATDSPAATPEVISMRSPTVSPVVTIRSSIRLFLTT